MTSPDLPFENRHEAGRALAQRLAGYGSDALVFALPRGGVPVAVEVAKVLNATLDVFVVRKLGAPGQPELALGAVASGGVQVLNDALVSHLGVSEAELEQVATRERKELQRREQLYRGERAAPNIKGRTVIVIDDGLATGATMRAAVTALRQADPTKLVAAVPVAAPDTCEALGEEVDEVVSVATPTPFYGVGRWYSNFRQVTDDEVRALLEPSPSKLT